jgi:GntR family transcriptional regulator
MPDLVGFTERMRRIGRTTASQTIAFTVELPSKSAAEALRMDPEALSIKLVRVRFVDDEPFMIETSYFPQSRFPALEQYQVDREPLYKLLSRVYNVQITEAQEALEPVILTAYEAGLLDTEAGRPGLLVEGTIYATGREPVEFTKSLVRGDKARFMFTLHRTGESDRG